MRITDTASRINSSELMNTTHNKNTNSFIEQKLILDELNAIVYVVDLDNYNVIYLNKYAREIYGNIIGTTCWKSIKDLTGPCQDCSKDYFIQNNISEISHRDELNMINDRWYETNDKIIHWSNGKLVRLHIAYDITERKNDEIKLKTLLKQQEIFSKIALTFNQDKAFADKVKDVLRIIGLFTNISRASIYRNNSNNTKTTLSYEWCNQNIASKIDKIKPINLNKENPLYEKIINSKIIIINNLEKSKYQKFLNILIKFKVKALLLVPIFRHRQIIGFLSLEECNRSRTWRKDEIKLLKTIANIISTAFERKNIEEKRLRSEQKLKIANATKDRFLSIMTRDLRIPFTDIKSLTSLLDESYDRWDDTKRKLFIRSVLDSSNIGLKLLENLTVWSEIQSKQIKYQPESIDIRSIIAQTIERFEESAKRKEITLSGIPKEQIFVHADYNMLNHIFYNLVNNAIKFSKQKGKVEIKLRPLKKFLEISICDTGVGVKPKDIKKLFRIDIDQATFGPPEEKGTGLGLIICKEFISKHGGKIWYEHNNNSGSKFVFTIPMSRWYNYLSK